MKQPDHESQNISNLLLLVNDQQGILLCDLLFGQANNRKFTLHLPMSLMVSPGSKGGSSISANLLVSLRTCVKRQKKKIITFSYSEKFTPTCNRPTTSRTTNTQGSWGTAQCLSLCKVNTEHERDLGTALQPRSMPLGHAEVFKQGCLWWRSCWSGLCALAAHLPAGFHTPTSSSSAYTPSQAKLSVHTATCRTKGID